MYTKRISGASCYCIDITHAKHAALAECRSNAAVKKWKEEPLARTGSYVALRTIFSTFGRGAPLVPWNLSKL